jgi:capsular polysaccharide biosynthesis protein
MALRQLDFEIIEPEDMSFEAQVAIFRGADIVVGLGGAGMFNTIFCKPGARVVTIESGVVFVNSHTNLFGSLGLDYGVILGEEDSSDPRPVQKRWTLNVPAAIKQITEFL